MKRVFSGRFDGYVVIVAALLSLSSQARAHHALNAFYDLDTPIRIEGTLTAVRWVNPHISFELEETGPDGQPVVWTVASGAPALVRRVGIDDDTFAVGAHVAISGFPSKRRANDMVGVIFHMDNGVDLPMFKGLAARLGFDLTASGAPVRGDAEQASAEAVSGIFRVWTFQDDPSIPRFEPEFLQSAIDARDDYDPLTNDPALSCTPRGMPFAMQNRFPVEFVEQNGSILLRLEMWAIERTIHMDGNAGGAMQPASPLGYSVGRWEGDSLLVTTTNIDWLYFDELGTPQSPEIEVEERFTLSDDATVLDYETTITDPGMLLEPAMRRGRWVWVPGDEIQPYGCTPISTDE
jgi:hypothetical protein